MLNKTSFKIKILTLGFGLGLVLTYSYLKTRGRNNDSHYQLINAFIQLKEVDSILANTISQLSTATVVDTSQFEVNFSIVIEMIDSIDELLKNDVGELKLHLKLEKYKKTIESQRETIMHLPPNFSGLKKDIREKTLKELSSSEASLEFSEFLDAYLTNHKVTMNRANQIHMALFVFSLISGIFVVFNMFKLGTVNASLNVEINERLRTKNLLDAAQKAAVLGARQAGMAEIATGILHNVGNILNSVNIGAETIRRTIRESEIPLFTKANALLQKNKSNLGEFLTQDPKGSKLPEFYVSLEHSIVNDLGKLDKESSELLSKIQLIKDVINFQQNHAKGVGLQEEISLQEVVEDALLIENDSLIRHEIKTVKKFLLSKPVMAQKAKLIHVLINIIKNAKEAMVSAVDNEKVLSIEIGTDDKGDGFLKVSDSGVGVAAENINKIFTSGFTTKKDGHGFGLHYCSNAVTEMGGAISVFSLGLGKGTTFTINFKSDVQSQKPAA